MVYASVVPSPHDGVWTRRKVLVQIASVPLAACVTDGYAPKLPRPSGVLQLIDAHCHLFNISDLPAASFTQIALLRQYQHSGPPTDAERRLRAALDAIEAILSSGVMSAAREAQLGPDVRLLQPERLVLSPHDQSRLDAHQREAEAALRELSRTQALARCGGGAVLTPSLGSILTWLRDLRSRRATLTRRLKEAHTKSGYSPRLLCPALVDYANWLQQPLRSPLPDQIRVAGIIAQNTSLPAVHGYAPFDPLRRALVRQHLPVIDGAWDPLAVVRDALINHAFIGVKLYPPMGFRASRNSGSGNTFPPHVQALFGSSEATGAALDQSLEELWQTCRELDAPIMAHGANSNAAGLDYGRRADPTYWLDVARRHPELRIMLAHFGRFRNVAAGLPIPSCNDDVPFEQTWEAVIGDFVRANPQSNLYADLSFMSELFHANERARAVSRMKLYLERDPRAEHLVFGSDWVMLGIEKGYTGGGGYPHRVASFLRDAGLDDDGISRVMYGNAIKFLGLQQGSRTRARLAAFYAAHDLPESRLPS